MLHAYGACPHRNRDSAIAKKKCIPNLTEGLGGGLYIENPRVPSSHWFLN